MLVLLPGMDGTGTLFDRFLKTLPSGCKVQVVRYPTDVELTYVQLEERVFQSLPRHEPITLIAESFSGPIALQLSRRSSLNVRAIVLVCSFASRPLGIWGVMLSCLPMTDLLRFRLSALMLRTFLLGSAAPDEIVDATRAIISSIRPEVLAGRLRESLRYRSVYGPPCSEIRQIAVFSRRDRLLGTIARRSIEKACSGLEAFWIDAPHFALQTVPDKILPILFRTGLLDEECGAVS